MDTSPSGKWEASDGEVNQRPHLLCQCKQTKENGRCYLVAPPTEVLFLFLF